MAINSPTKRTSVRYYHNAAPPGEKPDDRLWVVSIPACQMKRFKGAAERRAIWLEQVPRHKVRTLKGVKRRIIVEGDWSEDRVDLVFHVPAPGPHPWRADMALIK